ncbi:MFS transporter [Brevibacillus formosus]|uniref:MDR family MFS transporter n=1 Tax=Brevibacillus formosus TaxID=54913 RepID=UPI001C67404A|nr:MFS transporter [Brevibacillus formosus]MBW5470903.1 MFS transporter [Brevibacillus formosus]
MQWLSWDLNLKTRLIGETLFNLLFWMYFPFLTLHFSDTFGKNVAGLLMTVPPIMSMIGNLFGGYLADRFGRRYVMLSGAFLQAGMFVLFAFSLSSWIDYLAFIGIGLGKAVYSPASSAMVADLTSEKDRRRIFATFVTAMNIGAVLGPALGAIFFFQYRSELLWTCALVTFLYSIAIWFNVRETLPQSIKSSVASIHLPSVMKEQWQSYAVILRDKAFAIYIFAGMLITIAIVQLDLFLAVYVKEFVPAQPLLSWNAWSLSLSSTEIFGWMVGISGLLFVLCALPVTKWFENWSDRNVFLLSSSLFGVGMFLVGFTTNAWLLFGCVVIFTVGEVMRTPVEQSFVSKYAPEHARGQYMGAANLQYSLGRFLAPVTVILSEWIMPIGVFGFILFCSLLSAVLYVKLFQIVQKRESSHSS